MKQIAKALTAGLTTLGTWGYAVAPGGITLQEAFGLTGVAISFLSVWLVPNRQ